MIFSLDDSNLFSEEEKAREEEQQEGAEIPDLEMASLGGGGPSVCSTTRTGSTNRNAMRVAQRRSARTVTVLVLLLGCIASAAFLTIGILHAHQDSQRRFETDVEQLAVRVHNSFREYEMAALWVHQSSQSHKTTTTTTSQGEEATIPFPSNFRSLFRSLYDAVVAKGLPLHAIQYIPNVTSEQRQWYEAEATAFYQRHYPEIAVNYSGFSGFVPDDTVPLGLSLQARAPQDFYFPVHFVEPVLDNIGVLDFDVWSEDYPRWAVTTALETMQPVITGRLRLIQEPDPSPDAYSVLLMHPGLENSVPYETLEDDDADSDNDNTTTTSSKESSTKSGDISLIAIRIPSLLEYIATQKHRYGDLMRDHMPAMKVYLYDSTPDDPTLQGEPLYLGGTRMDLEQYPSVQLESYLAQIKLSDLEHENAGSHYFYETQLEIGYRQWTLACVAVDGTYPPQHTFAIMGGVMILLAFLCLSLWVYTQMSRTAHTARLKAKAQEEQALLRIDHARQAAAAERQLNEFIAHEVRNPLAAAMSACSFVTSAIEEDGNRLFEPSSSSSTSAPTSSSTAPSSNVPPPSSATPLLSSHSTTTTKPPKPLFQLPSNTEPMLRASNAQSAAPHAPLFSIVTTNAASTTKPPTSSSSSTASTTATATDKPLPARPLFDLPSTSTSTSPSKQQKPLFSLPLQVPEQSHHQPTQASSSQAAKQEQQQQQQQQKKETKEEVLADLHIIDSSLNFINELLRNMLDVQRAACHQLKIEKGPTDLLRDILEPVDAMLYRRGRNSVEVKIDCPNPHRHLLVEADRLRLKQVVLNLGRNASKFVDKGWIKFRVVVVDHKNEESTKSLSSSSSSSSPSVQIWVEDTGVGIPEEKKGKLFNKFQESLDSLSQGTGLGLSLCKILVRLMGGDIWLDETYHSGFDDRPGSRFIIDLNTPPMMNVADDLYEEHSSTHIMEEDEIEGSISLPVRQSYCANNGTETSSTETTRGVESDGTLLDEDKKIVMQDNSAMSTSSRRRDSLFVNPKLLPQELSVLFVDDDTVLRKLLVRAVRAISPGWMILEAASGEAALRLIDDHSFDLIFMDQYMASTEKQLLGTETTQALRSKGVQSKICGLSANEMATDFFAAGADAFVCKPLPTKKASLHQILCEIVLGKVPDMEGAPPGSALHFSSLVMTPASGQ